MGTRQRARRALGACLGAVVLAGAVAAPGWAVTIPVNTTDDGFADTGTCTLREALSAANTDSASGATPGECPAGAGGQDLITVPTGAYTLHTPPKSLGGEDANAEGDLDVQAPVRISGKGAGVTIIDGNFQDRVLDVMDNVSMVKVTDLTVTHGRQPSLVLVGPGGGIRNAGELELERVVIADNRTFDPAFSGLNGGNGGGVANIGDAYLTVLDSVIAGNRAGNGSDGANGANGGCPPENGHAGGSGGSGGAIWNPSGTLGVLNSTIVSNSAGTGGRGGSPGQQDIDCSILGFAGHGGDGGSGGGIYGLAALLHVTLSGNSAGAAGAGGLGGGPPGDAGTGGSLHGTIDVKNSVLVSTSASNCGVGVTGDYDVNFGGGGCPGVTADPLLGTLQDNGGPTPTMAIAPGSPAMDIVPSFGAQCLGSDQRGTARPFGLSCDAGAFEYTPPPPATGTDPTSPGTGGSGGSGGPGASAAFGADTLVSLRLARRRIPARGPVRVVVTNGNAFAIAGRVSGVALRLRRQPAGAARVRLRARSLTVAAESRATVALRLPRVLRRVLARRHRLVLRIRATVTDPAGNTRTVRRTLRPRLRPRGR